MFSSQSGCIRDATLVSPSSIERRPLAWRNGRFVEAAAPGVEALLLPEHLVFPALINAHDHLQLNNIPPPELPGPFPNSYQWIEAFQAHFRASPVEDALRVPLEERLRLGALKNAGSGALTVAHHDPRSPLFDAPGFPVRVPRLGWCHSLHLAGRYGPGVLESLRATPPTLPWLIHLAEGTDADAAGELRKLLELGVPPERTVLIHAVGLSDAERLDFLESGGGIVWCPSSNLRLLGRTLDPRPLLGTGRLALGTDSRISGAQDLLEELRLAHEGWDLSGSELLALVTTSPARILRLPDQGGFEPGHLADFIVLPDRGGDPRLALAQARPEELRLIVRGGRPAFP